MEAASFLVEVDKPLPGKSIVPNRVGQSVPAHPSILLVTAFSSLFNKPPPLRIS